MGESENGLKRQIGLFGAVAILVGAVIGSGIFMTPGTVAASAKSFGPFMVAWILAGASGILCSLVYAELSPAMPKAGGPYVYITEAPLLSETTFLWLPCLQRDLQAIWQS